MFNAIPDTNHNANPTNPNRYSKGNPNLLTLLTLILDTVVNMAPTCQGLPETWHTGSGLETFASVLYFLLFYSINR